MVSTIIVVAAVGGLLVYQSLPSTCTFTGVTGPVFLRVVSDSNQTPIAGAQVAYTNTPISCNGGTGAPEKTQTFVTNGTEWHPLNVGEDISSSIVVSYPGQAYSFSTNLYIEADTCITLSIPSGETNTTFEGLGSACPPETSTESTSSSNAVSSSSNSTDMQGAQSTQTTTTTTDPTNHLELRLSLNASSPFETGATMSVFVDAYNPSLSSVNVTSASDYAVPLGYVDGAICGDDTYAQNPTVGFAITEGHYAPSNVTEAKLLDLVNPNVTYSCPLYLGYANPAGFLFQPLSDMAASYGCGQNQCISGSASTGAPITGYWNQGGTFISFPKGTYTVLAEDEWGALAFAYFSIS